MAQALGIERTLRVLLRSDTPMAAELLLLAVRSESAPLRVGAVRALIRRSDLASHDGLVAAFSDLRSDARKALVDSSPDSPFRKGLSRQLLSKKPQLALAAAQLVRACGAVEQAPSLVKEATRLGPELGKPFVEVVKELAHQLADQVFRREQGETLVHDPSFARRAAVASLSDTLATFKLHGHVGLVESFVLLASYGEHNLMRLLHDEAHSCHGVAVELLRTSTEPLVGVTMAEMLKDKQTPRRLLEVISRRVDPGVLSSMLGRIGYPVGARAKQNAYELTRFLWTEPEHVELLTQLKGDKLAIAIELAASTKMSRGRLAEIVVHILQNGDDAARLAACESLALLPGAEASGPAGLALDDPSPAVVCAALSLVRAKHVRVEQRPLLRLLDHHDAEVRKAVQRALQGVSFSIYREYFEELTPEQQRTAGEFVLKADHNAVEALEEELTSGAAERRLRGLGYVESMAAVERLLDKVLALFVDSDSGVRAEAARIIGQCEPNVVLAAALATLGEDNSAGVRRAAEQALETFAAAGVTAPSDAGEGAFL